MRTHAIRLSPGADLMQALVKATADFSLRAGCILTCVGSLQVASLRLANRPGATIYHGKYEIVSLVGTLCPDGPHVHISISDGQGVTIGGHLLEGCQVYTTAEIVLGELEDSTFTREFDPQSGYEELVIRPRE